MLLQHFLLFAIYRDKLQEKKFVFKDIFTEMVQKNSEMLSSCL